MNLKRVRIVLRWRGNLCEAKISNQEGELGTTDSLELVDMWLASFIHESRDAVGLGERCLATITCGIIGLKWGWGRSFTKRMDFR